MSWRKGARDGALVGLAGGLAFFLLHAAIIEPIWGALPRGALAIANGALLGVAFQRLRAREDAFAHPLGGMALGGLAALALAPFLAAGWLRTRGAPDFLWGLILGLLLVSLWFVTQAAQTTTSWRRAELPAALLVANAFPAWLLVFIADLHEEVPDPFPFTLAIAAIYLASGAGLTGLAARVQASSRGDRRAEATEAPKDDAEVRDFGAFGTSVPSAERAGSEPTPTPEPTPAAQRHVATFEVVQREPKKVEPKKKTTTFEVVKKDEKKK